MKAIKLLCAALAAVSLAVLFSGCRGETELVAGIDVSQVPLSFRDSGETLQGFEIDMATEAAKRAGFTVRFVPIDWSRKEQLLREDKVNSLWGTVNAKTESAKDVLLTEPYLSDEQVFVVPAESNIKSKSDLTDMAVGVIKGSEAADVLHKDSIAAKLSDGAPQMFDNFNTMFQALQSNQIDALAVDDTMGEYYISQNLYDYRILSGNLSTEQYAVAVRRNDSRLRNSVEAALTAMKKDGTTKKLSQKWFGKDFTVK